MTLQQHREIASERLQIVELKRKCENLAFLIQCECWSAAQDAAAELKLACSEIREARITRILVQQDLFPSATISEEPGLPLAGLFVPENKTKTSHA